MTRRDFLTTGVAGGICALFDARLFAAATAGAEPPTLVLGGTAFALGVALANPARTVVLERGIHLAPEFSLTGDWADPGEPTTPLGKELLAALAKDGLITDGKLELPPLSDFLQGFFADHGGRAFFNAELAYIRRTGGVRACIYGGGAAGLDLFAAGQILDTTDIGWRDRGMRDVASKSFSAITDRGLFTVALGAEADWREARLKLYEAFGAQGNGAKLLAENNAIRCRYKETVGKVRRRFADGVTWIPSAQYSTFIRAFEEGFQWNLG